MTSRTAIHLLAMSLALGGCSLQTQAHDRGATTELTERVAGPAQRCVTLLPSEKLVILDGQSVRFRSGPTLWVNRLRSSCHGLDPTNTLVVEANGSQLCSGDHIRVIQPPLSTPGPICFLGDFVPFRRRD